MLQKIHETKRCRCSIKYTKRYSLRFQDPLHGGIDKKMAGKHEDRSTPLTAQRISSSFITFNTQRKYLQLRQPHYFFDENLWNALEGRWKSVPDNGLILFFNPVIDLRIGKDLRVKIDDLASFDVNCLFIESLFQILLLLLRNYWSMMVYLLI